MSGAMAGPLLSGALMAAAFWFLSKKYPDFLSRLFGFREEQASLGARLRRLIGNGLLLALLLTVHFSLPDYEMPWLRWGLHVPLALGAAMVLLFRTVGALLNLCFDEKPDLRKPVPVSVDRLLKLMEREDEVEVVVLLDKKPVRMAALSDADRSGRFFDKEYCLGDGHWRDITAFRQAVCARLGQTADVLSIDDLPPEETVLPEA